MRFCKGTVSRYSSLVLGCLLALGGCVSIPTQQTLIERGEKPRLDEAISVAQSMLKRTLKDFDSIKDFAVVGGDLQPISAVNFGNNFEQAWMLCIEYNAKNSYGGYGGIAEQGIPMRVGADGKPFVISTVNWKHPAQGTCR